MQGYLTASPVPSFDNLKTAVNNLLGDTTGSSTASKAGIAVAHKHNRHMSAVPVVDYKHVDAIQC